MDTGETIAIANTLAEYQRCFTREELLSFTYIDEENYHIITKTIEADPRFTWTSEETAEESIFIARKALYHWYVRLNVRLARCRESRLSDRQLALLMSSLRLDGKWASPPTEYVKFGQQCYLISPTFNQSEYIFPLAHVLSFMTPSKIKHATEYIFDIPYDQDLALPAEQIMTQSIQNVLDRLTNTQQYIIIKRQGILGNTKMTLELVGQNLGVTRERVRQIEEKCWKRLWHPRFSSTLVATLVSYILCRQGSLIINPNQLKPEISFITKCLNFPLSQFPHTDLLVIGEIDERLRIPEEIWKSVFDIEAIVNCLQSHFNLVLIRNDLVTIAEALSPALLKRLTKSQEVYLALKSIGRPAHYSEITEVYNYLFPENPSSEHNIHAILSREQHGVVWIGIRSTFALKEWGYEHPSATLFETILGIVQQKFTETSKPVPFAIIAAEVGKYRRVVKPASVTIAAYYNPNLENVYDDYFIPRADNQEEKEVSAEKLDKILQEFERRSKRHNMTDQMTYDRALQIANEALEAYKKAKTKAEVEEIFIKYGRQGIGYRPLCRIFFSQMPPAKAVMVYKKT